MPQYQRITNFAGGLNSVTDPRRLKPNSEKETMADAQEMTNMDITKTGAIITSTGFELAANIDGASGGIPFLHAYDKDVTDRYLFMANDDDYYSITPTNSTPSSTNLGDYGTAATFFGATTYLGTAGDRRAIIGNDVAANNTQSADIDNAMGDAGAGAPDGYIMTPFMGRLFIANGTTLSYSEVDDETTLGGSLSFNDIITGLKVEGKRLIAFTRTYNQGIFFDYDNSFNLSVPLREPYEREYGAVSHTAITQRSANMRYWANDNRVYNFGTEEGRDELGLPRPMPISTQIDPSLESVNLDQRRLAAATYVPNKEQWFLSVPIGTSSNNNLTFVYYENWNSWGTRAFFNPASWAVFRDSDYQPALYFGDALSPNVYKMNDEYSYNGVGYTRRWRSKKFTMGDNSIFKEWRWIDISGAMDSSTLFTVRITVDNNFKEYQIDNTHLQIDAFGEYIGDNLIGDAYIGGATPSESRFKRFKAHIPVHRDLREGFEIELMIYNDGAEQPWKIDEIGIDYEFRPRNQRRQSFINNNPLP